LREPQARRSFREGETFVTDAEGARPQKRELTPLQKKIRRQAKDAASQQGHDWASLSREDRKAFKDAARESIRAQRGAKRQGGESEA
jgi:hypothetical protein